MNKLATSLALIPHLLSTYPALSSALLNIGVSVAAYYGLNISGPDLLYMMGVVTTLFGAVVHSNVTPLAKLKPDVPKA